jgi:hypothetical protein
MGYITSEDFILIKLQLPDSSNTSEEHGQIVVKKILEGLHCLGSIGSRM